MLEYLQQQLIYTPVAYTWEPYPPPPKKKVLKNSKNAPKKSEKIAVGEIEERIVSKE